jgi:hypothetical protein
MPKYDAYIPREPDEMSRRYRLFWSVSVTIMRVIGVVLAALVVGGFVDAVFFG